jgi:predicted PurR-regulated permease PerM
MRTLNPRKVSFFILFLLLFLLVARLFYPFLTVILWSGLLYVFLEPLHRKVCGPERARGKKTFGSHVSAIVLAVLGVLILLVPLGFLAVATTKQLVDLLKSGVHFFEANADKLRIDPQSQIGTAIQSLLGDSFDIRALDLTKELQSLLASGANQVIRLSTSLIKNVAQSLVAILFIMFTLYYLLMDGTSLGETLVSLMPIDPQHTRLFMRKLRETGRQLVLGYFLVALFQGLMMFIVSLIFGFKNNVLLAVLTAISSFIPMLGTSIVWVPMGLSIALKGDIVMAIVFLVCAGIAVSALDNFIRPVVLGGQLKVHPLLLFFSIVGGLAVFGFNGIILGPLVLVLFIAAGELYRALNEESEGAPKEASVNPAPQKEEGRS